MMMILGKYFQNHNSQQTYVEETDINI